MVPKLKASALVLAAGLALVAVVVGSYLQPDTSTPPAVRAILCFFAILVVLSRFRRFRPASSLPYAVWPTTSGRS